MVCKSIHALAEEEMRKFARLDIDPSTITWQRGGCWWPDGEGDTSSSGRPSVDFTNARLYFFHCLPSLHCTIAPLTQSLLFDQPFSSSSPSWEK